jgi:small subunit ribosomal protein S9
MNLANNRIHTLGKRKTSVARVYMKKGTGVIGINGSSLNDYFSFQDFVIHEVLQPLKVTHTENLYDIFVNVHGGGFKSQAEAIRLGISRALCEYNVEHRTILKPLKFLTRDSRIVERKKYGRKKARKRFQFSKR